MDRREATRNLAIALHDFAEVLLDEMSEDAASPAAESAPAEPAPAPAELAPAGRPEKVPHGYRRNTSGKLERL